MGIFTRLRDIVNANINAMLEKAEDPEKLIKLMVQEMEDTLVEIKASTAGAMATQKKVARQLEEARARLAKWEGNAELAVRKGRDDLAREALQEKRAVAERVAGLERELQECEAVVEQYKEDIAQLEEKLAAAKEKHRSLVERHIHARQKKAAQTRVRRADSPEAVARFAEFEGRIERMEAEADLVNPAQRPSLEEEIAGLETDEAIEAELRDLKARAGQGQGAG
jgi:phage shock protein A